MALSNAEQTELLNTVRELAKRLGPIDDTHDKVLEIHSGVVNLSKRLITIDETRDLVGQIHHGVRVIETAVKP